MRPEYSPAHKVPSSLFAHVQLIAVSPPTAILYAKAPEDDPVSFFWINVQSAGIVMAPEALSIATAETSKLPAVAPEDKVATKGRTGLL